MNLNQFYNIFVLGVVFSALIGKTLVPDWHSNPPEIISKKDKHREYYELNNNGLEYIVEGPSEVKIFSKAAYPKKTNNELKEFGFNIFVNDLKVEIDNYKKLDKKTFSSSHPMHLYTYSSKDIIVLPSGTHNIKIEKKTRFDFTPILIRAIRSGRKSKNHVKEEVILSEIPSYKEYNSSYQQYYINNNRNTISHLYHFVDSENPLFLKFDSSGDFLEVNLRGLHNSIDDIQNIITMTLKKNDNVNGRYHILSIPHPAKFILDSDYIPSRLNKIYIKQPSDNYYEFNVGVNNEPLLVKINKMTNFRSERISN